VQRKHNLMLVAAVTLLVSVGAAGVGYKLWRRSQNRLKPPPTSLLTAPKLDIGELPGLPPVNVLADVPNVTVSEVARELRIIWSLRWAPDGRLFICERRGRLLVLKPGAAKPEVYARLSTALGGESGLMGLALHPDFPRQPFIYVMYTARKTGGGVNRISRFTDTPAGGDDETVLIDDIPASRNHDGGALEFGPDGMLYVGTGDANVPGLAQELDKPNGKILRVRPDGSIPPDNPFPNSAVWAYGFRNVSGLAFHPTSGELWAASHGPSAVEPEEPKHMDSVYIVRKGANHGWPLHLGVSAEPAYVSPTIFFKDRATPPGGLRFHTGTSGPWAGSLFMTGLRNQELMRFRVDGPRTITSVERWWPNRFGRLRAVTQGPDGSLYVGTSNADGRAEGNYPPEDFIYRLTPSAP
jgi:glucose/arabinose dehydrogenase